MIKFQVVSALIVFSLAVPRLTDAATKTNELDQANRIWKLFNSCKNTESEKGLDNCLTKSLSPTLDPLVNQKMTEYILMDFKFSDLRTCTKSDKVLPLPSTIPTIHYCLDVLGKETKAQGYATFEQYKKELRLTSIRYDITPQ